VRRIRIALGCRNVVDVLRYAMSSRWVPWHLLSLAVVGLLITLGFWQFQVATAPLTPGGPSHINLRNLVYSFQWWAFALFGVWFWFRFIRDQRDVEVLAESEAAEQSQPAPSVTPAVISLDASAAVRKARVNTQSVDLSESNQLPRK